MKEEFNLSKKICKMDSMFGDVDYLSVVNVKEFIKRLKELNFGKKLFRVLNDINKLAGLDLIDKGRDLVE